MQTPEALLRQRIRQRQKLALDPSEADEKVLELQLQNREPLTSQEASNAISVAPDQTIDVSELR